jgi:VanZ family protein
MGAAVLLEILQTLTPDRHGTLVDAVEKMAGAGLGIILATAVRLTMDKGRAALRFSSPRRGSGPHS